MRRSTVADRWQVASCLAACSAALSTLEVTGMGWEDCHALINVPEALSSQPVLHHNISELAAKIAVGLANGASTEPPSAHQQSLSAQLHRLPASMRLQLLQGCQLGYPGMLALLSSEEQVTDSEDGLALALLRYLQQGPGCVCSAVEAKNLKDQLRATSTCPTRSSACTSPTSQN
ncbi:MAG: hypothetical protein WDW36_009814 [Sanguina aurantia]